MARGSVKLRGSGGFLPTGPGTFKPGRNVKVDVINADGVIANLFKVGDRIQDNIKALNREYAQRVVADARRRSPVVTGLLRGSLKYKLSPQGKSVEIFSDPQDFISEGQKYYFPFHEFGTENMSAKHILKRAFARNASWYKRNLRKQVRLGIRRGAKI